ncbi:CaiB/BaiF CoA transferase family protein [Bacillus thermotolerans]|uniref:CaiB/BaiF CoA transferase family protein n=1 Tax=Bacillus thermotolerans TaxID=1221996 RepID=UPI00057EE21C|nr:CoA transferase [Bacillus thermotolerans]KKB35187.1 L-carnitine dehydratase/bile acid-inducible protein F [Bacillus thermotolerans]
MQPLSGVRVIDISHVLAGPYCTMIMGDMGAEVIKVEQYPDGDMIRDTGPFINGVSYSFTMINRNKKGIKVNLRTEEGREILYRLVKTADVFVENFRPDIVKKLGIDYDTLKELNPDLIYCSISGYGQTGPLRNKGGLDIMAQGMSGIMSMTGEQGGRPVKVGIPIHDIGAGLTALYHILFAHIHKMRTGEGQYIDVSLVESALVWTVWEAAGYFGNGEVPVPSGTRHRRMAPYQSYKTKTGYILLGVVSQRLWEKFCREVVDKEEWLHDPRFATVSDRLEHVDQLEEAIEEVFGQESSEFWLEKLESVGIPSGPIYTYDEVMNHEQVLGRDMVIDYEHPVAGPMKTLGFPAKMSKSPAQFYSPAPQLGEHSEAVLRQLDYSEEEIQQFKKESII